MKLSDHPNLPRILSTLATILTLGSALLAVTYFQMEHIDKLNIAQMDRIDKLNIAQMDRIDSLNIAQMDRIDNLNIAQMDRIDNLGNDLREEIRAVRTEAQTNTASLRTEIGTLRTEAQTNTASLRTEIGTLRIEVASIGQRVSKIEGLMQAFSEHTHLADGSAVPSPD